ncbi:MAG: S1 RNA-binding domain-containing protein [Chloroflexota bacterium]|jgi:small subunit ribosomal protein S1
MIEPDFNDAEHPMNFLLSEEVNFPNAGEIRSGRIVAFRNNEILVDIGAKSEGIITSQETNGYDSTTRETLLEGVEILVYVEDPEDINGNIILSFRKAAEERDWQVADELLESQEAMETEIVGFNKGGVLVSLGQLRGFVPNSQLKRERLQDQDGDKQRALQAQIGQKIFAKVIEVDRPRNRLILSEQAASREIRQARKSEFFASIEEGMICDGQVVNLAEFGAFVDIGGIEGLVHLSEMSWKRIQNPSDLLQRGDQIKVQVINVDQDRQRVALSMKRLEPDPWSQIEELYRIGQLVEAEITRLTKFGAFARVDDEYQLEGLIHISELAEDRVEQARDVVKPGDRITVRIIRLDPEQRQVGLSLRQVSSDKYIEDDLAMLNTM